MSFDGKVAIVTGGTKGIGFAIAEELLKNGASVLICGRNRDDAEKATAALSKFGTVEAIACDIRNEDHVKALIEHCDRTFGGLDILINNAGVGFFGETVEELAPRAFRETIETNLLGTFYACHFAIPVMKKRNGGSIVNISSLAGQNAHPKMAAYNASKFGLNGFTESLMQEVRHDGIRVSLICPGSVNTDFGGDKASDEKFWQLQSMDVAEAVMNVLRMNHRALISKVELRPSMPPKK